MAKKVTPMMEQYLDIKSRHSDELLFFRLGDFYELFNEDALIASRELNITLTGRPTGNEERTPMCGVPFHAAESYIETLVKKGYKVAICEQLEDPKAVKGIVKRDVIQVITPGTVMTENGNDARSNNFLALFYLVKEAWILVFSDVSTGEVIWNRVPQDNISQIYDSLSMYRPAEIIVPEGTILPQSIVDFIHNQFNNVVLSPFTSFESVDFDKKKGARMIDCAKVLLFKKFEQIEYRKLFKAFMCKILLCPFCMTRKSILIGNNLYKVLQFYALH